MQTYKVRLFYDRPGYTLSLLGTRVLAQSGETVYNGFHRSVRSVRERSTNVGQL